MGNSEPPGEQTIDLFSPGLVRRDMILSRSTINEALSFLSGRLASTAVSYRKDDSLPHFLENISQKSRYKCV